MTRNVRSQEVPARDPGTAAGAPRAEQVSRDDAIDVLFRASHADLLRLAYCMLGDRARAEDVVQDAFVSLYQHWNGLRDRDVALAYVRSAVLNRCRSGIRDLMSERSRRQQLIDLQPGPSAEEDALSHDDAARLVEAVRVLPRRQREVVLCRYYLGLSVAETADLLSIAPGSVKRHAFRAMHSLTNLMEGRP